MPHSTRFVMFNVVGALGIVVQLACVALLTNVVRVHYIAATTIAVSVAVVHNFLWHRWWTWRDRCATAGTALLRFVLANGIVSLVGNLGVTATLVSGAHVAPLPANVIAIAVCGVLNFWLGETFVFRR